MHWRRCSSKRTSNSHKSAQWNQNQTPTCSLHAHWQDVNKEDWEAINGWLSAIVDGLPKLGLKPVGEAGVAAAAAAGAYMFTGVCVASSTIDSSRCVCVQQHAGVRSIQRQSSGSGQQAWGTWEDPTECSGWDTQCTCMRMAQSIYRRSLLAPVETRALIGPCALSHLQTPRAQRAVMHPRGGASPAPTPPGLLPWSPCVLCQVGVVKSLGYAGFVSMWLAWGETGARGKHG
jgi:hypothetical protein